VDRIITEQKDVFEHDKSEPPVAFLNSLLLGEVLLLNLLLTQAYSIELIFIYLHIFSQLSSQF
jgi:hypothetical protein